MKNVQNQIISANTQFIKKNENEKLDYSEFLDSKNSFCTLTTSALVSASE